MPRPIEGSGLKTKNWPLLRHPPLSTAKQRWDVLLNCIRKKGGPKSWARWVDLVEDHGALDRFDKRSLTETFSTWKRGEKRSDFKFSAKMAILQPIIDFIGDSELAWSAYWLESGCAPYSIRGSKITHEYRSVRVIEPGDPECSGGKNIHDRDLAKAYRDSFFSRLKRGRPSNTISISLKKTIEDGRNDFPPWYRLAEAEGQHNQLNPQETEKILAEWICSRGPGAAKSMAVYFKGEPWMEYSPMARNDHKNG